MHRLISYRGTCLHVTTRFALCLTLQSVCCQCRSMLIAGHPALPIIMILLGILDMYPNTTKQLRNRCIMTTIMMELMLNMKNIAEMPNCGT
jgi:hypothetical protein